MAANPVSAANRSSAFRSRTGGPWSTGSHAPFHAKEPWLLRAAAKYETYILSAPGTIPGARPFSGSDRKSHSSSRHSLTNRLLRTPQGSALPQKSHEIPRGFQEDLQRHSGLTFESTASQTTPVRPPEIQGKDQTRSDRPRLDSVPPEMAIAPPRTRCRIGS